MVSENGIEFFEGLGNVCFKASRTNLRRGFSNEPFLGSTRVLRLTITIILL